MHPAIHDVLKAGIKEIPELRPGYTIEVHQKIKEGDKERVQIFHGLIIKIGKGGGIEKTVTVRKIVEGVGVEKIFPIHSPNVVKIVIKKKGEVRRAKLYYMRSRAGKSTRLQEMQVIEKSAPVKEEDAEKLIEEAVAAAKKKEKAEADAAPAPIEATKA